MNLLVFVTSALNQALKLSAFFICQLELVLFFHSGCPLRRATQDKLT